MKTELRKVKRMGKTKATDLSKSVKELQEKANYESKELGKAIKGLSSEVKISSDEFKKLKEVTGLHVDSQRAKGRKPSGLKRASKLPMHDASKAPELGDTVFGQVVIGYKKVLNRGSYTYYHTKTRDSRYYYNYLLRVARNEEI